MITKNNFLILLGCLEILLGISFLLFNKKIAEWDMEEVGKFFRIEITQWNKDTNRFNIVTMGVGAIGIGLVTILLLLSQDGRRLTA